MKETGNPIAREDLVFDVEQGLRRARKLWPRTRTPGDVGRFRPLAAAIAEHLELCRVRCFRAMPRALHRTPPGQNGGNGNGAPEREARQPLSGGGEQERG